MEDKDYKGKPILIAGSGKLAYSVTVCLLQAGHPVTLYTRNKGEATNAVQEHFADLSKVIDKAPKYRDLEITEKLEGMLNDKLAIVISGENVQEKRDMVMQLEGVLPRYAIIAVNMASIPLSKLQENSVNPGRIIGLNWTEPAHTTYFLELITNAENDKEIVDVLYKLAKAYWGKDPYIVCHDYSIQAKLFAAMVREAFYLVEHEYASIGDIDRACRNDAGYYLPFAGNFRYIDLMGTYAYGMVMKELNPTLSKDRHIPEFFRKIIREGGLGMDNNKGFYTYTDEEMSRWKKAFRKFSYQIQQIMNKYPFNYKAKSAVLTNKTKSDVYE